MISLLDIIKITKNEEINLHTLKSPANIEQE